MRRPSSALRVAVREACWRESPDGFLLASGERSPFYFDKYGLLARPDLLRSVAAALSGLLPAGVDRLAGVALGAVPLATAAALHAGVPLVLVRGDDKAHGVHGAIEGPHAPGERAVLIEDVLTTGAAALRAIAALRAAGLDVACALALLDRGGAATLRDEGLDVRCLFALADFAP